VTELQCLWSFVRCPKPISAARSHECEESKAIKLSDGVSQLSPPLKSHECSIIISPIAYKVRYLLSWNRPRTRSWADGSRRALELCICRLLTPGLLYPHSCLSVRFKLSLESCQTGHCQAHPSLFTQTRHAEAIKAPLMDAPCFVIRLADLF
jgi:hypothetical protein